MVFHTGAALLDAIVLAVVSMEETGTYGYRITQDVRKVIDVSESTLYPVLRRLQKDEITIVNVCEDSPADKAGLKSGDILYKVDEHETAGYELDTVVSWIHVFHSPVFVHPQIFLHHIALLSNAPLSII